MSIVAAGKEASNKRVSFPHVVSVLSQKKKTPSIEVVITPAPAPAPAITDNAALSRPDFSTLAADMSIVPAVEKKIPENATLFHL
jgi:hypothetical protein